MKILVCTEDPDQEEMSRRCFSTFSQDVRASFVRSLTEAYNLTEHHLPDLMLVDSSKARLPEFELLASLAKHLKIKTAILTKPGASQQRSNLSDLPEVPPGDVMTFLTGLGSNRRVAQTTPRDSKSSDDTANSLDPRKICLIGASTGGVDAIIRVLRNWGPTAPPTLVVQHTGASHTCSLVRLLNSATPADIQIAKDGMPLRAGQVYLAPGDGRHLGLADQKLMQIKLNEGTLVSGHRPSIDMLFRSAVPFGDRIIAALLTGMGQDGARELLSLRKAGAVTIGQDQATSVVYGMPRHAMDLGAVSQQLPIDKIGPAMLSAATLNRRAVS